GSGRTKYRGPPAPARRPMPATKPRSTLVWGEVKHEARDTASPADPSNRYSDLVVALDDGTEARIFSDPGDPLLSSVRRGQRVEVEVVEPSRKGARRKCYLVQPGHESAPPGLLGEARRWARCYAAARAE